MRLGVLATLAVLTACSDDLSRSEGTLVYATLGSPDIHLLDVATGEDRIIAHDLVGNMTIAPDGEHVAYIGDGLVKVIDRSGTVVVSMTREACPATGPWISPTSVAICVRGEYPFLFVPALGAAPRTIPTDAVFSVDGNHVAYGTETGDILVERVDGSESRVVLPATPSAGRQRYVEMFTPDGRTLIVSDASSTSLVIVSLVDGATRTIDDARMFRRYPLVPHTLEASDYVPPTRFIGGSELSADGAEVLIQSRASLEALDLATATRRAIAPLAPTISVSSATFLDDRGVAWIRLEAITSPPEIPIIDVSARVTPAGASDDVVLDEVFEARKSMAVLPGAVALAGQAVLVATDGRTLVPNLLTPRDYVDDIIGVLPDGRHVITTTSAQSVAVIGLDGSARRLSGTVESTAAAAYAPE